MKKVGYLTIKGLILGIVAGLFDFILYRIVIAFESAAFSLKGITGYVFFVMPLWIIVSIFSTAFTHSVEFKFKKQLAIVIGLLLGVLLIAPLLIDKIDFRDWAENFSKVFTFGILILFLLIRRKSQS